VIEKKNALLKEKQSINNKISFSSF